MQKKLIALAVVAAFSAPAFADTTVYGIVDAAVANVSSDAAGAKSHLSVISGGLSTSRFGVKSVEDLDNGMKAVAVLEYGLDVANNTTIGMSAATTATAATATTPAVAAVASKPKARQQMLALAGGFGTVAAGYLQTTGYDWGVKFDPTAGSAVSSLASVNGGFLIGSTAAASRAPHALAYISPDMSGLTVAVNRSFDVANQANSYDGKQTANLVSATYAAGPLAVGAVYAGLSVAGGAAGTAITDLALGASYDLGAAKLLGTYQTSKTDATGAKTDNALSFSVVAPVGSGALVGSVAKNDIKSAATKRTSFTVAYLQGLSKTVTAYGALQRYSDDAGAGSTKVNTTVLAVGLKKAF